MSGGPPFRFGSGYLIGPERVLTAGHTLLPPGEDAYVPVAGDRCEVLPWGGDPEMGWLVGHVRCCDLELDLALVSVPGLAEDMAPVRWGRLDGSQPVRWDAIGFPVAGLDDKGREPEHVWGEVSPATQSFGRRLGLVIGSRTPRATAGHASGWAGLSGAAVVCDDRLVGVIIEDPPEFVGSLTARRIDCLAESLLLYAAAGSPVIDNVSAESADDSERIFRHGEAMERVDTEGPYWAAGEGPHPGNPGSQAMAGPLGTGSSTILRRQHVPAYLRKSPPCLLLTGPVEESTLVQIREITAALDLDIRISFNLARADELAARKLRDDIATSIAIIAIDGAPLPWIEEASANRPVVLVADSTNAYPSIRSSNLIRVTPKTTLTNSSQWPKVVAEALRDVINILAETLRFITSKTTVTGIPTPSDLFDLPLDVYDSQSAVITSGIIPPADLLFPQLFAQEIPRTTVITGLPGSGKSVLLTRYSQWLRWLSNRLPPSSGIPALPVVLRAKDLQVISEKHLPDGIDSDLLWKEISALIDQATPANVLKVKDLATCMREAGKLLLIIDGLDEYGSRNQEGLAHLLAALDELAQSGISLMVACRSNFWNQQVKGRLRATRHIALKPLGEQETRRLLQDVPLPRAARDTQTGQIADWLRSPLLVRFLRQLRFQPDPTPLLDVIESRTAVYRAWSRWVASEAARKGIHDDFSSLCEEVALQFVRERSFELNAAVVLDDLNLGHRRAHRLTTLVQLDALEVFDRSMSTTDLTNPAALGFTSARTTRLTHSPQVSDGLRFQHETILEFFATQALSVDFIKVLNPALSAKQLEKLRLSQVTLDHFQSSVYGFVDEMLEPVHYRSRLVNWLNLTDLQKVPEPLGRNLIEYLGLTVRSYDAPEVSHALCRLVCDTSLTILLRYNAARALERSHPAAPHPYYEYVSDWGTTDFSAFTDRQISKGDDGPWVMRGWHSQEPACRRYLTFGPNDPSVLIDNSLQLEISGQLISTLAKLIDSAPTASFPLRVNISLALVRWYHSSHYNRWLRACRMARARNIEPETIENIEHWIMRWR